jgi:hypothetical protein
MVLLRQTSNELQTLDYDNILLRKVQFLPIIFYGDILFKLSPIHGHAWNKLVTTNIKKSFGLSFRKACCLGYLQCVQNECENFVHSTTHNETFWCGECIHIPILGQMTMIPSSSSLGCKFC